MFQVIDSRPAPVATRGAGAWLRQNLFSSWFNGILTVITGVVVVFAIYNVLVFILVDGSWAQVWRNMKLFGVYRYPTDLLLRPLTIVAVMMGQLGVKSGASGRTCIVSGAFSAFQGLVGRLSVVAVIFWPSVRFLWPMVLVLGFVGYLVGSRAPRLLKVLPWAWVVWLFGGLALLYGVTPGSGLLRIVPSRDWGGFLLT